MCGDREHVGQHVQSFRALFWFQDFSIKFLKIVITKGTIQYLKFLTF